MDINKREGDAQDQKVKKFVLSNIKALECTRFVKGKTDCCCCGREQKFHSAKNNNTERPWSNDDLKKIRSNAYGDMKLRGFRSLAGFHIRYIRASQTDNLNKDLYHLMTNLWEIPKPELIISINGGAKKMIPLSNEQKSAFKRGLVNVSKAASTWIITGGFNFGVPKLVGEAARDHNIATQEKTFTVLGIGTWGAVYNRQELVLKDSQQVIYNNADGLFNLKGQAPLDPNHDAFILFDSGKECVFGEEINFRAQFETFLSETAECSVVQVIVEGGKKCIVTAEESLNNGIPVVIMKGSKRAADLICDVIESDEAITENIIENGLESYKKEWGIQVGDERNSLKNNLLTLKKFREQKLIHIFSMNDFTRNLDRAILEAAFSGKIKGNELSNDEKLKLAMTFNRPDVAEECILESSNSKNEFDDYREYIKIALIKNQWKFVSLFISRGTQVKSFLTKKLLEDLYFGKEVHRYINVSTTNILWYLRNSVNSSNPNKVSTIGLVIKKLTKNLVNNMYPETNSSTKGLSQLHDEEDVIEDFNIYIESIKGRNQKEYFYTRHPPRNRDNQIIYTEQDLFVWAILTQRWEMAKIFWENGKDHIGSALIAAVICTSLSKIADKEGEAEMMLTLQHYADEFEGLAINILTEAYWRDKIRTHLLLSRALPFWSRLTCMEIANKHQMINFLSQTACQTRLNYIWLGGMSNYINMFYFLLNLPFGFLTSKLIIFRSRKMEEYEETPKCELSSQNSTEKSLDDIKVSVTEKPLGDIIGNGIIKTLQRANDIKETTSSKKKEYLDKFRHRQQNITSQNIPFCQAVSLYYNAPVTKFAMQMITYMLFLAIFSYMNLVELLPLTSVTMISQRQMEYAVYTYIAAFVLEEIRKNVSGSKYDSFEEQFMNWISSWWNVFDLIVYIFFFLAVILRHIQTIDFVYARTLFSIALSMFYLRFFQFYYVNRFLGPKVISVTRMIIDVIFFLGLYIIAIFAYGTFAQALLFSNSPINGALLKNIVYMPYWQSYADLSIEYVEGSVPVNNVNPTPNAIVIVAFAFFILFANALLMNMLVAMFAITIGKVEDNSNKLWAFNRYALINEFYFRPILPPPLNFIEIIIRVFHAINCKSDQRKLMKDDFVINLNHNEDLLSSVFEQQCLETHLIDNPLFKSPEDHDQKSTSIKINKDETVNTEKENTSQKFLSIEERLTELMQELKNTQVEIHKIRKHQKRSQSLSRMNTIVTAKKVLPIDYDD